MVALYTDTLSLHTPGMKHKFKVSAKEVRRGGREKGVGELERGLGGEMGGGGEESMD
jgi:hypothetical protein